MNKIQLHQQLMTHLQQQLNNAQAAAKSAHETATNEENIAENQYDTLALEAAYLAHGQSQRALKCQADIDACISLPLGSSLKGALGSLVVLVDQDAQAKYLFICPVAGGVKLKWQQHTVLVVTPESPIGAMLLGQKIDAEVSMTINNKVHDFDILQII
ncbi:transcription elongation factor [Psychromonas sp. B3M02]|uniref:transcription elongation factor n=1 Tax=unclassified Psychromonas TaxID=2614957 RepID=UPI000DEBAACC|nr:transcription elongation factor [Psychromonas sp. B3M02]RBW43609.1 transcription elongation factor [Psychromonas sp. B3M02]